MSSVEDSITQLPAVIAAQEAQRPTLGGALIEVTLAVMHSQLADLKRPPAQGYPPPRALTPDHRPNSHRPIRRTPYPVSWRIRYAPPATSRGAHADHRPP